jgi:hypothetical protein
MSHDPVVAKVGDKVFSRRFLQVLNTCWMAGIAPFAVTGNFTGAARKSERIEETYTVRNAQLESSRTVLVCDTLWCVVVALSSLAVMFAAGLSTTILNLVRKSPEILDGLASMLRDSHASKSTRDPQQKTVRTKLAG